jgi:hypothetical protein
MTARSIYLGGAGHSQNLLLLKKEIKPGSTHVVTADVLDTIYSFHGASLALLWRDTGATLRTGKIGMMRDISVQV